MQRQVANFIEDWVEKGRPGPDSKRNRRSDEGFIDPDLLDWFIPWPLIPESLGCSDLHCDGDGLPDVDDDSREQPEDYCPAPQGIEN